jgi:hypothetical protein
VPGASLNHAQWQQFDPDRPARADREHGWAAHRDREVNDVEGSNQFMNAGPIVIVEVAQNQDTGTRRLLARQKLCEFLVCRHQDAQLRTAGIEDHGIAGTG